MQQRKSNADYRSISIASWITSWIAPLYKQGVDHKGTRRRYFASGLGGVMLLFAMGAGQARDATSSLTSKVNWRAGDYTSCRSVLSVNRDSTILIEATNSIFKCNGGCPDVCEENRYQSIRPVEGVFRYTIAGQSGMTSRFSYYSSWSITTGLVSHATWMLGNIGYNQTLKLRTLVNDDYYLFKLNDGTVFAQQNAWEYGHLCKDSDLFSKEYGCKTLELANLNCSDMRTEYEFDSCKGEYVADSVFKLLSYYYSWYGKDSQNNYKNLRIEGDIVTSELDIRSPCKITVGDGTRLEADKVVLDGRYGVENSNGYTIKAKNICLLSERRSASLGKNSVVTADNLTIQGATSAQIRNGSKVTLANDLTLKSSKGSAKILSDTVVEAENLTIDAKVGILYNVSQVLVHNDLIMLAKGGLAMIRDGNITVEGDMTMSSELYTTIFHNASVDVAGNFGQYGKKCIIDPSSTVTVGANQTSC